MIGAGAYRVSARPAAPRLAPEQERSPAWHQPRTHQEKRFCAPKSRQKSQHFTTSLDSVWLHLNSVWVSQSS